MSRIRTVKPELFRHEELFDAELASGLPLRLAFIGLFTVADCEGRFVWKPRTLKLDVLPHDIIEFSDVLAALEENGFIQSYVVDGKRYGWIPSFRKHQRIQTKELEAGSTLPAPTEDVLYTVYKKVDAGYVPENTWVRTGTHPESQEVEVEVEVEVEKERITGREEEGKGVQPSPAAPRPRTLESTLPADFEISESVKVWAEGKGFTDLEAHLEAFKDKAAAKGYRYVDWDAAFKNAIREDWAGLRKAKTSGPRTDEEILNDHRIITNADRARKHELQKVEHFKRVYAGEVDLNGSSDFLDVMKRVGAARAEKLAKQAEAAHSNLPVIEGERVLEVQP
jgi:hypothetical protein